LHIVYASDQFLLITDRLCRLNVPDQYGRIAINVDKLEDEDTIYLDDDLAVQAKPHQVLPMGPHLPISPHHLPTPSHHLPTPTPPRTELLPNTNHIPCSIFNHP
jgi:hypothetical protein